MPTADALRELVLPKLERVKKSGAGFMAQCPVHEDGTASLSVSEGKDHPVVLYCLAGETRIITREGTRTLAELAGGIHELLVPGPGGAVWRKSPISSFGVQRLMKLTLRRFNAEKVLYATREHRWFTERRNGRTVHEVITGDLLPGMRLKAIATRRRVEQVSSFGVAHGFTYGDGTLRARGLGAQAQFCGAKDAALLSYFPHMSSYTASDGAVRIDGLPSFFKRTPALAEGPAYLYGWLAGYFAADGSIEGPDGPAVISSANRKSLEFVRELATRLGIVTYPIQEQVRQGFGDEPSTLYKVTLRALDLTRDFFVLPAHRDRWAARTLSTSYDTWRVVSVEASDRVEEVYCATVEGPHAFALEDNILTGNCHAGCQPDDILDKLALTWEDLSKPRDPNLQNRRQNGSLPAARWAATYDYVDENGKLLFQVCRSPEKKFLQRRPDPTGKDGWSWKLGNTRRVPYRLPQLLQAVKDGKLVFICEGEKDVHTIERQGFAATCNPGGAGKWKPEFAEFLREATVTIVADRDDPGQAHARQVRDSLLGVATYVEIAEAKDGKDVTDHITAGHGLADLVTTWTSEKPVKVDLAPDLWEFISVEDEPYDWIVPDLLERGDRLLLTGFEGLGKALALETPIPTPKGWATMADLEVGSEVFGPDGKPTRVVAATPVMTGRTCYRVRFSDGAEIVADAHHLWVTETLEAREATSRFARRASEPKPRGTDQRHKRKHFPAARTTEEIAATLHARGGHTLNHSIQVCAPLEYPAQELPIDPYVLGAWLGDGATNHAVITSADPEIVDRIRSTGEPVRRMNSPYGWAMNSGDRSAAARAVSLQTRLRQLEVLGDKHIPRRYLEASVGQRLELLRGLMDTDGTVQAQTRGAVLCEFSVCLERLARDVLELLHGLGVKVTIRTGPAKLEGRTVGTRWRLAFQTDLPVFHLPRKSQRLEPLRTRRAKLRYITAVEPIESAPVRCIQVDRVDGMFVAGRGCIPTHNSQLARQMAVTMAAGVHPFLHHRTINPARVLVIDCENSERQGRRKYRQIAAVSTKRGCEPARGMLRLIHKPEGIDLTRGDDAEWLMERVTAHKPDVLFIGPFYRLHNADIRDEVAARHAVSVLDAARNAADCALIIEAHAGHGEQGKGRSVRPVGSSLLLRWPEFGFGLAPCKDPEPGQPCMDVEIRHWRGQRDVRNWPGYLTWGDPGDWPWKPSMGPPMKGRQAP